MRKLKIKVFFAVLLVVMVLVPVNAMANASVKMKNIDEEFYIFTEVKDKEKVSKIIGESQEELKNYCANNGIVYLAVNDDNSKQIRISRTKSNFSEKIGNLSFLTNDEIKDIFMGDIKNSSKYRFAEKNSQKFIVLENIYSDSGGKFVLTQYITVANENLYTLSFYTAEGVDTGYIENVFSNYGCDSFLNFNSNSNSGYTFLIVTALLALLALWIVYTIIRDLLRGEKEKSNNPL